MEEIISRFDKVMEEYNEKYTAAETDEQRAEIDDEYEIIISEAEKTMQAELEAEIQRQEKELEAEQLASEKELEELELENEQEEAEEEEYEIEEVEEETEGDEETNESRAEKERIFLVDNANSAEYIAKRYNVSNSNKNGFSTREIAVIFDVNPKKENGGYKTEKQLSEEIYKEIENQRQ